MNRKIEEVDLALRLGSRIKRIRIGQHLTQDQLAEKADISVSFLSMIERGQRFPHLKTLSALAASLNVGLDNLLRADNGRGDVDSADTEDAG